MKKLAFSLFLIAIVVISTVIIKYWGNPKMDISDKGLEIALLKSMEETQKDNKKLEQLVMKASQELNNKGYDQLTLGFSFDEHTLTVQVPDEEFVKVNRGKVENIILNVAKEMEFQHLDVEFIVLENYLIGSMEQKKITESINSTSKVITDLLKEKGAINYSITMHPKNEIIIEGTDIDYTKKDEMEKLIAHTIFSKTNMNFTVKIQKISANRIREQNWQPVFTAIIEETRNKFDEYRGFAYSFHPEPLQIIIKTDLEKPKWLWGSKRKVKQIKKYVDKVIELKSAEISIEKIPYEIIIRDKNNQIIK